MTNSLVGEGDISLLDRMLVHDTHSTTDTCDSEMEIDSSSYIDDETFRREIDAAFRSHPQLLGHVSQFARAGQFVSTVVAGVPVVAVCGRSGGVRAFVNRCRHRGAPLVDSAVGRGKRDLVCPYHGWCYSGDDGSLKAVPSMQHAFPRLDCATRGLVALPTYVAAGFVWVCLTSDSTFDGLSPLVDDLLCRGIDDFEFYTLSEDERSFNWKLGIEGFLENYHFAFLHRTSTHPVFIHDLALVDDLGNHLRAVAPKRSLRTLRDLPRHEWDLASHVTMMYVAFPSTCIFVERDVVSVLQLLPSAVGQSLVRIMHVVRHEGLGWRDHWDQNIALFMAAVDEDLAMYEQVQRGLEGSPGTTFLFGRNEPGLQRFRTVLATELRHVPMTSETELRRP